MPTDASDVPQGQADLFVHAYEELKHLARYARRRGGPPATLDTTALVHETYLRIRGHVAANGMDAEHLKALASRAMRQILVDHARKRIADKRGGGDAPVTLERIDLGDGLVPFDLAVVDRALTALEGASPRLARLVEMHVFGGMTMAEIGHVLAVAERTVFRDWRKARAFLIEHLDAAP